MKVNEILCEATVNEVAIIFGRFNPPHKGHRAAWELMSKYSNWYVGTNAATQGPKDPLPFDVKIKAMKTIYPELEGHLMSEQSWLTMASKLYNKYPQAKLLVFTDEAWVVKTLVQYNGVEGKEHGFYNFKAIEHKPTPRLSSATDLRNAVEAGDRKAFAKAAGVSANTTVAGKPFFDLVSEYLLPYAAKSKKASKKIKENTNIWSSLPSSMKCEDKLMIIETYFVSKDNLLESNSENYATYFESLKGLTANPETGKTYIIALLGLVNNNIVPLDNPAIAKVIKKSADGHCFENLSTGITSNYPNDYVSIKMMSNTFFFENSEQYDKFNTAISIKFGTSLPTAPLLMKEAGGRGLITRKLKDIEARKKREAAALAAKQEEERKKQQELQNQTAQQDTK